MMRWNQPATVTVVFWTGIAAVWLTAALMPIYPDEIAYRLIGSRVFFDHGMIGNIYPTCPASYVMSSPISWFFAQLVDYLAYGWYNNPIYFRITSLVIMCVAFFGSNHALQKLGYSIHARQLFIFLLSLGIIPTSLILARPEGLMLTSFLGLMSLSFSTYYLSSGANPRRHFIHAVLFFILASLLLSAHPQSFLYLPALAVLFLMWSCGRTTSKLIPIVLGIALVGLIADSAIYWVAFSVCPENTNMQSMIDGLVVSPKLLVTKPFEFFRVVGHSLVDSGAYFKDAMYRHRYMSDWLPRRPDGIIPRLNVVITLILGVVTLAGLGLSVIGVRHFFKGMSSPRSWCSSLLRQPLILFNTALIVAFIVGMGLNKGKQFYETAFFFPLMYLVIYTNSLWMTFSGRYLNKQRAGQIIAATSIVSGLIFMLNFLPFFVKGYQGIGFSPVAFSSEKLEQQITAILPLCGINPNHNELNHMVVDDMTYQYLGLE